jgi:hypothetical protein
MGGESLAYDGEICNTPILHTRARSECIDNTPEIIHGLARSCLMAHSQEHPPETLTPAALYVSTPRAVQQRATYVRGEARLE